MPGSMAGSLAEFYRQRPDWTRDGDREVATIKVPMDYARPDAVPLEIPISRIPAADPARRRGVLLSFTGGPGGNEGLGLAMAGKFAGTPVPEVYDLIGFEPRGYGGSPQLFTEVTPKRAAFDSRPDDAMFPDIAADALAAEQACLRVGGELRRHINTRNIARDMDVIRGVLGEEKISFVGYAYGSYVGAVYGSMFGAHLDRCVMDSAVHPDWLWRKQFMMQAVAIRRNVETWAGWVGERHHRFGLGSSAAQVLTTLEDVATKLAAQPAEGMNRTTFDGAVGNGSALRTGWANLADLVRSLRDGATGQSHVAEDFAGQGLRTKGSGALTSSSEQKQDAKAGAWVVSGPGSDRRKAVIEAVTCEADWPTDLEVYYEDMRHYREHYPYGFGVLRAQPWVGTFRTFTPPEPLTELRRDGYSPGLVVQAEADPLDPVEGAVAIAGRLGFHLIVVADDGGHELYPAGGNELLNSYVNGYLVDGKLPAEPRLTISGTPRLDIPSDKEL